MHAEPLAFYMHSATTRTNWSSVKKYISNHYIGTSVYTLTGEDDGYLKDFIARTNPMSPDERGAHLEGDEVL